MLRSLPIGAALLVALSTPVSALERGAFGFRSGVSIARISQSTDGVESGSRIGFAGGFYQRITLGGRFSLQPEVLWISKGGDEDLRIMVPGEVWTFHAERRLNYLEIPVLARFELMTDGRGQPYLATGPAVAFRTSAHSHVDFSTAVSPTPASVQMAQIFEEVGTFDDPNYRTVDWGWIGGAGVLLGRGSLRYGLEARYGYGLSNLFPSENVKAHNHALAVTAAIEMH